MLQLFWNSIKEYITGIIGLERNFELPISLVNDKVKCLDYDMDSIVLFYPPIRHKKINTVEYEIYPLFELDDKGLNNI